MPLSIAKQKASPSNLSILACISSLPPRPPLLLLLTFLSVVLLLKKEKNIVYISSSSYCILFLLKICLVYNTSCPKKNLLLHGNHSDFKALFKVYPQICGTFCSWRSLRYFVLRHRCGTFDSIDQIYVGKLSTTDHHRRAK